VRELVLLIKYAKKFTNLQRNKAININLPPDGFVIESKCYFALLSLNLDSIANQKI